MELIIITQKGYTADGRVGSLLPPFFFFWIGWEIQVHICTTWWPIHSLWKAGSSPSLTNCTQTNELPMSLWGLMPRVSSRGTLCHCSTATRMCSWGINCFLNYFGIVLLLWCNRSELKRYLSVSSITPQRWIIMNHEPNKPWNQLVKLARRFTVYETPQTFTNHHFSSSNPSLPSTQIKFWLHLWQQITFSMTLCHEAC